MKMESNHQFREYGQIWKRLVAGFTSLSNMSCTLVSCDILNVCGGNSTKIRLYEEFQYNTDSAERSRKTTVISNSQ